MSGVWSHRVGDTCPGGHGATGLAGVEFDDQLAPQQADDRGWSVAAVSAYYEGLRAGRRSAARSIREYAEENADRLERWSADEANTLETAAGIAAGEVTR